MRLASSPPSAEVAGTGCCKHCQQEPRKKCQLAETVPLVGGIRASWSFPEMAQAFQTSALALIDTVRRKGRLKSHCQSQLGGEDSSGLIAPGRWH